MTREGWVVVFGFLVFTLVNILVVVLGLRADDRHREGGDGDDERG